MNHYDILVIGGGPGGMRSALFLADRGHRVTIFEAESQLGGAIRHADYVDFKWTLRDYKNYLIFQVKKKGINVVLNTRVTPDITRILRIRSPTCTALTFPPISSISRNLPITSPIPELSINTVFRKSNTTSLTFLSTKISPASSRSRSATK